MLSGTDLEQFFREGYAGPFDLPQQFVRPYTQPGFLESVCDYFRTQSHGGATAFCDRLRNQHLYSNSLCTLVSEESLLSRVRSLLGPDLLLWLGHVAPRLPGETGQQWHVDADNRYVRGIHVSIALSDNTVDNGCLQLIPGSHLFRASLDAAASAALIDRRDSRSILRYASETAPWKEHAILPMSLRSGQYFVMSEGMWHFVGANITGACRLNVVARYARTDVTCRNYGYSDSEIDTGELLSCILVSGRDRFGINRIVARPSDDIFHP